MRIAIIPGLLFGALLLAAGCKKETDPRVHPSLAFKSSVGYTSADDSVPQQDTLKIGAVIDKTEDPLISMNITRTYDSVQNFGGEFVKKVLAFGRINRRFDAKNA